MFEHGLCFPTSVVNSVTFPLDKVFTSSLSAHDDPEYFQLHIRLVLEQRMPVVREG